MRELKHIIHYTIIVFFGSSAFYSCEKTSSSTELSSNMTANIAGNPVIFTASGSIQNSILVFGGEDASKINGLYFDIPNLNSNYIGTYKLNNYFTADYSLGVYIAGGTPPPYLVQFYYSTDSVHTGLFNISSFNPTYKTISGTFSFTGYLGNSNPYVDTGTVTVVNGTFFINLQ